MKLKILAAPILIISIVIMSIWVVYPAFQDLQTKKSEMNAAQVKLTEIQKKNSLATQLGQTLVAKSEQKDSLLRYIPEQQKEEEVISNLNALAGTIGLSVYNISIGGLDKKEPAVIDTTAQPSGNFLVPITSDAAAGNAVPVPAKPEASTFKVALGVTGNYAKIKDLLSKIAALQRFNSISELKISRAQSATSGGAVDNGTNDSLQADISLNFNFINKSDAIVNLNNEIFTSGNFDMAVVDGIKNQMTTVINGLTAGASGVQNPFVK